MEFEVIDEKDIPEQLRWRKSKYADVKAALEKLPLGKALRWNTEGLNLGTVKANIPLWGAQMNCIFTCRKDKESKVIYIWKLEKAPRSNGHE